MKKFIAYLNYMRPLLLSLIFCFSISVGHTQTANLPTWFSDAFKSKGLDKKFELKTYLKPSFLQADFNGDKSPDVAILVIEKGTRKKGILIIHAKTNEHYLFGAGTDFGNGDDNFSWMNHWFLYTKKIASETKFDSKSGDIIGSREIKLKRPAILIESYEDGAAIAGELIYWNGKKYISIHQGE